MQFPDVKERLQGEDMDVVRNTPQEFDAVRGAMLAKWSKIIRQTGIQAD